MAAEDTGTVELTPEQKVENMLFPDGETETESPEELEAVAEEAEEEIVEEGEPDELEADAEAEDDAAAEEEGEPELFDVEIDGQVYEVPAPIRDQLSQADDYTQKTQGLAEDRKALDVVRDQVTQTQQEYEFLDSIRNETDQIQTLKWQMDELKKYKRENIDSMNGNDLEKINMRMDMLTEEHDGIVQAVRAKHSDFQQAAQQAREELRAKSTETLKSRLPSWGDDAEKQSTAYGLEVGFSQEELDMALDPRERQVLWEASEYRRLKAATGQATRKARSAKPIQPKGRRTQSKDTRRKISVRKRLNSAGSEKEKADIIRDDIAQRFNL